MCVGWRCSIPTPILPLLVDKAHGAVRGTPVSDLPSGPAVGKELGAKSVAFNRFRVQAAGKHAGTAGQGPPKGQRTIQYSLGQQGLDFYIEHFRRPFEHPSLHFLLHPQVYLQIFCCTDFGYEAPKKFLRTLCCRATIGHLLLRGSLGDARGRLELTGIRSRTPSGIRSQ